MNRPAIETEETEINDTKTRLTTEVHTEIQVPETTARPVEVASTAQGVPDVIMGVVDGILDLHHQVDLKNTQIQEREIRDTIPEEEEGEIDQWDRWGRDSVVDMETIEEVAGKEVRRHADIEVLLQI
jgi:hypothetical protein